ncbi:hypothetical protein [Halomicrobium urmianum]|uniref:hypothetical protein n=1 Tax=Halomicrobium urmianum TaxID=1586233 RepID=UPI001CD921B2|nr:hypothetical protein [Halomicrobium urmianum]
MENRRRVPGSGSERDGCGRRTFLRTVGGLGAVGGAVAGGASTGAAHHVEDIDLEPEGATLIPGETTEFTVHWVSGHGSQAYFVFAIQIDGEWREIDRAEQSALSTGEHVHPQKELTVPGDVPEGEYTLRVSASEAYHRSPYPGEKSYPILAADAGVTVADAVSVERKRGLIDTIRANAGGILTQDVANPLDARADDLLDDVEVALSGGPTAPQYEEALSRMINAELAAESAVSIARDPARKLSESITELVTLLAFAKLAKGLVRVGGRAGAVVASKFDDVIAYVSRGISRLSGKPILPVNARRRFDEIVTNASRRVGNLLDEHQNGFTDAGKKIVSGSAKINEALDILTGPIVDALSTIKESTEVALTVLYYKQYLTQSRQTNEDGEVTRPRGVDESINQRTDELSQAIASNDLGEEGGSDRERARRKRVSAFEDRRDAFMSKMSIVDEIQDTGSLAVIAAAGFSIMLYMVSVVVSATGIGIIGAATLAGIASKLSTVASLISFFIITVTGFAIAVGYDFLQERMRDYEETVNYIVNYERVGSDLP